ncbi:hypothetical protein NCS57_00686500 [Fusarium keratoplasticum]|uniref:Uncharacterized protein n=1 Tax=Fusarium keratoplasticum TaxID=1328300 RepID=A0ACC0QYK7_9HYPO|nr:hypothetical protein NCS57_00686500 [Fusarium keratoplasticum]KAI8668742.1 hypothetical protein NCS57_00686500 [Fusarium keratoplasticum]KAI8673349.1 hypothetical protein NCS55_00654300 [Fusarium keratoplasticum]
MSSSASAPLRCRTINDVNLPAPATKLIITQHLQASRDSPYWAWIIVGAFYDSENNIVWSTEIFAGHLDVEVDSDEESGDGESVSTSSEVGLSDSEDTDSASDIYSSGSEDDLNIGLPHRYRDEAPPAPEVRQVYPYWYESTPYVEPSVDSYAATYAPLPETYAAPPETWDPTRQGPVPGYWQASFDPEIRRWVHTWQPLC